MDSILASFLFGVLVAVALLWVTIVGPREKRECLYRFEVAETPADSLAIAREFPACLSYLEED